jgi:hypothetical protein
MFLEPMMPLFLTKLPPFHESASGKQAEKNMNQLAILKKYIIVLFLFKFACFTNDPCLEHDFPLDLST